MNILGLVLSLLLIISYGFYATWDKHITQKNLYSTYRGHEISNRKIHNRYQSEIYKKLGRIEKKQSTKSKEKKTSDALSPKEKSSFNRPCSRLNLWPLVQEGKNVHPELYDLALKTIKTLYAPLLNKTKHPESLILNQLIAKIRTSKEPIALEKIDFENEELQRLYYKMLKGSTNKKGGFPPLLDYIKIEPSKEKICIHHAHPNMLQVIFNKEIATALFNEINTQNRHTITQEMIERICQEKGHVALDPNIFSVIELKYFEHQESIKPFVARDKKSGVFLRKDLQIQ